MVEGGRPLMVASLPAPVVKFAPNAEVTKFQRSVEIGGRK